MLGKLNFLARAVKAVTAFAAPLYGELQRHRERLRVLPRQGIWIDLTLPALQAVEELFIILLTAQGAALLTVFTTNRVSLAAASSTIREVTTDASGGVGYGFTTNVRAHGANWTREWEGVNIALKELYAVHQALASTPSTFHNQ